MWSAYRLFPGNCTLDICWSVYLPKGSHLRSDQNRDRLGAGQPRRPETLRHRLLDRPRDLEKFSLFFFDRIESEIDSEQGNRPSRDAPTSTTWPATGLRKIFTFFSIGPVLFDHNQRDALSLSSFRYLSAARPTWQVQFSDNQSPIHNLSPVRLWAALSSLRISLQPSQNDHKASKGGRSSTSS